MSGPSRRTGRPLARSTALALALVAAATGANAQFAAPVQTPHVEGAGTVVLAPTIGVLDDDHFTDVALMLRGRYSATSQLSLGLELGGAFGDADDFVIGVNGKIEALEQTPQMPVEVAIFGAFDAGIGDTDAQSLAFGPLVGHRFDVQDLGITPYGGFGLGFTHWSDREDRFRDDDETDVLFAVVLGAELAFSPVFATHMEFDLGTTDASPALVWNWGISYAFR